MLVAIEDTSVINSIWLLLNPCSFDCIMNIYYYYHPHHYSTWTIHTKSTKILANSPFTTMTSAKSIKMTKDITPTQSICNGIPLLPNPKILTFALSTNFTTKVISLSRILSLSRMIFKSTLIIQSSSWLSKNKNSSSI